jgi:rare lipoprotein A (peptidoglycan hydrolase)
LRKHPLTPIATLWVASVIFLSLVSCKSKPAQPTQDGLTGIASWYGVPFNGRATASGEIYDMEKLTAAHRTLPLGTVVEVNRTDNGLKVQVKINDRGPFVQGRIIDLSHAAAQTISMPGIANVQLKIISQPATRGVDMFAVQVGSFADRASAEQLREQMQAKFRQCLCCPGGFGSVRVSRLNVCSLSPSVLHRDSELGQKNVVTKRVEKHYRNVSHSLTRAESDVEIPPC